MPIENLSIALNQLQPHKQNYNRHSPEQIQRIAKSLEMFGQARSVVVWKNPTDGLFYILAGHGVVAAARSLGWTELRADVLDESWSEDRALAYLVADNELARRSDPDQAQLAAILEELQAREPVLVEAAGYTNGELEALLRLVRPPVPVDAEPQIDRASELQQKWQTAPGQLWACGEHRLIVGDCTDAETVARVMGGERAGAVVTDPPYGIHVNLGWLSRLHEKANKPRNIASAETVIGDDGLLDIAFIFEYPQWFVWGFPYLHHQEMTGWVVWDKWPGVDGGGLGNPVEMAFSNCFVGFRLWRVMWGGYYRDKGETRQPHPTQKPIGVIAPAIELTSGDIYDPFLGSGTTLIACENLSRRCRAIEISEAYVAVALERFATATGKQPHLLEAPVLEVA